jgi:hypothetical protein
MIGAMSFSDVEHLAEQEERDRKGNEEETPSAASLE